MRISSSRRTARRFIAFATRKLSAVSQPRISNAAFSERTAAIFWGLRSITRIEAAPDDPFQKITMIQDITEQKQAEGKIRFQAQLLASVEQAVIATDMSGSIIFWNRFAENLFGWPAATAIGSHIEAIVPAIKTIFEPRRSFAQHRVGQELVRRILRAAPRRLDHPGGNFEFAGQRRRRDTDRHRFDR